MKHRRFSFCKSFMQHCCVGYLLSSVPQVAGGGCGWSNTQMHYTDICGGLSREICMSNMTRSVYSMNKLTCQHKPLPSVHTAPTWLDVSEALACAVTLKWMLDKCFFVNQSSTSDTKEATTTPAGVAGGNRAGTRPYVHQHCCSPSTLIIPGLQTLFHCLQT